MLNYNLDSVQTSEKFIRLCEKYQDDMDIEITYGRQTIDGCRLFGLISLIEHFMNVQLIYKDREMIQRFAEDLEWIK